MESEVPELQPSLKMALAGTYIASLGVGLCMGYTSASWKFWYENGLESSGWFHSMLPIGGVVGTAVAMFTNHRYGWNQSIMSGAVCALACFCTMAVADELDNCWCIYFGVFLMGVTSGMISNTVPGYLHELSHHKRRGALVSGHYSAIAVGVSLSLVLSVYVQVVDLFWTGVCLFPFLLGAALMALAPTSPVWLVEHGVSDEETIKKNIVILHGNNPYANKQVDLLKPSKQRLLQSEAIAAPNIYRPLAVVTGLMLSRQATGISGVLANLDSIAEGGNQDRAKVAFALSQVVASVIAPSLIDQFGRTRMLQFSGTFQTIGLVALGVSWTGKATGYLVDEPHLFAVTVSLCIYVTGYSLGHGPIPWVMINELLPPKAKAMTTAASTSSNWVFDTVMTQFFTFLVKGFSPNTAFFIYAAFAACSMLFVKMFVPETAGLNPQELQEALRRLYDNVFNRGSSRVGNSVVIVEEPEEQLSIEEIHKIQSELVLQHEIPQMSKQRPKRSEKNKKQKHVNRKRRDDLEME